MFTNGKCLEDTFQFVHYIVCISNVKMIQSREKSFVWGKQFLIHSKPEFCVLLIIRVWQLPYIAYIPTPTFTGIHMILDMHTLPCMLILPYDFFKFFKICMVLIILYCLKTYCYKFDLYFFGLGRGRFFTVYICFKETLFFNFSYKLFNKYFSLPQSTSQFGVSFRK